MFILVISWHASASIIISNLPMVLLVAGSTNKRINTNSAFLIVITHLTSTVWVLKIKLFTNALRFTRVYNSVLLDWTLTTSFGLWHKVLGSITDSAISTINACFASYDCWLAWLASWSAVIKISRVNADTFPFT